MRNDWPLFFGASWLAGQGVRFRVWAPAAGSVEVEVDGFPPSYYQMRPDGEGVFATVVARALPGTRYKFRLDGRASYPDPYSRKQPDGVHGPSEVVDPRAFLWHDRDWRGIDPDALVIYECHVGTYTQEGTFDALIAQLPELHRLGVTALELMPVAEFAGRWNWGYDGVDLFAPTMSYGGPDALKRLIDAAHRQGLAVFLDVVYNHLGPAGNYLRAFAPQFFTDRYPTPWGEALNFDDDGSEWVRHFVVQNACYWLSEFHFDGLRLDATHAIFDRTRPHILTEIAREGRQAAAGRRVAIIAEDANNDVDHIRPTLMGGRGLDGVWADDFHHALRSFLTGDRDGYFADYGGKLAEVAKAIKQGFVFQGQRSRFFGKRRGTHVTDEPARSFVFCLQNHDQVGNRAYGDRLSHAIDKARYLAASALLLLAPETPLLFMGQEFAASAPFRYFTDHEPELGKLVTEGRRAEFKAFRAFADPANRERIPDPQAEATFLKSKLDLSEQDTHIGVYACYRDLLRLRRHDPVLSRPDREQLEVKVLGDNALAMHRWNGDDHRLLIANFGGRAVTIFVRPKSSSRVILTIVDERSAEGGEVVWTSVPDIATSANGWRGLWSSVATQYWDAPREQPKVGAPPGSRQAPSSQLISVPPASAVLLAT